MKLEDCKQYTQGQKVVLWHWDQHEFKPVQKEFRAYGYQFAYDNEWEARVYACAFHEVFHTLEELIEHQVAIRERTIAGLKVEITKIREYQIKE